VCVFVCVCVCVTSLHHPLHPCRCQGINFSHASGSHTRAGHITLCGIFLFGTELVSWSIFQYMDMATLGHGFLVGGFSCIKYFFVFRNSAQEQFIREGIRMKKSKKVENLPNTPLTSESVTPRAFFSFSFSGRPIDTNSVKCKILSS
jgi:hypothetical protein